MTKTSQLDEGLDVQDTQIISTMLTGLLSQLDSRFNTFTQQLTEMNQSVKQIDSKLEGYHDIDTEGRQALQTAVTQLLDFQKNITKRVDVIEVKVTALENPESSDKQLQSRHPLLYKFAEMTGLTIITALLLHFFPAATKLIGNILN